jgi:hypothetical protein
MSVSDACVSQRELTHASGCTKPIEFSSLPFYFGVWLSELVGRLEAQEREIAELKKRLGKLEPIEAPLTAAQLCERHGFKPGTVRDWLFHRSTNGLESSGAVITKNRRVLLYEVAFLRWLRETASADRRLARR